MKDVCSGSLPLPLSLPFYLSLSLCVSIPLHLCVYYPHYNTTLINLSIYLLYPSISFCFFLSYRNSTWLACRKTVKVIYDFSFKGNERRLRLLYARSKDHSYLNPYSLPKIATAVSSFLSITFRTSWCTSCTLYCLSFDLLSIAAWMLVCLSLLLSLSVCPPACLSLFLSPSPMEVCPRLSHSFSTAMSLVCL